MSLKFRAKRSGWSQLSRFVATFVAVSMLPWYAVPVRSIEAAPVSIPTLTTPGFQTTDLDPHFQLASSSNTQEGWESIVALAKTTLSAQWETTVDAQIQAQVAAVNETDSFNTVQEYRDFLNQALQLQRQQAISGWALAADARIELERAGFVDRLATVQRQAAEENNRDNLNAANVAETTSEVDAARAAWQQQFDKDIQTGLTQYQSALAGLYADYNSVITELQQKDQQFANDRARILQYEQVVRTAITNSVTQLDTLLQNSGLFYAETCDGQNNCSVDTNTLNTDGQTLQNLITTLRTGLTNNQPLSTLAQQMVTYLQQQELAAQQREQYWQVRVRGTSNYNSTANVSAQVMNGGTQTWVVQHQNPPPPWEWIWGVSAITGLTGGAFNLGALAGRDDIGGIMDFHSSGDLTRLRNYFASTGEYRTVESVNSAVFGNAVGGVFSHQPGYPPSTTPLYNSLMELFQIDDVGSTSCPIPQWHAGCEHRWHMRPISVTSIVSVYNWYDSNADSNRATWNGYANSLGPMANSWANDILPAIQAWEQQVADFDAAYTTFQTTSATLVTQAQQELTAGQGDLFASRTRWLAQMQGVYEKGRVRFDGLGKSASATEAAQVAASVGTVTGPSVDQIVDDRRLRAINAQLREIASAPAPTVDTRNLESIYKAIPQTFNGLANLAIASNLNTQAIDAQREVLETAVSLINGQGAAIEEHKYTAEITSDGRVVGRRQIHTGEAIQQAGTEGTSEEHYDAVFEEQAINFEGTSAVKLATTGDLFTSWDYGEVFSEFSSNQDKFQEEATLRLKNLEGNLEYASSVAQDRAEAFQNHLDGKIEGAQFTKSIIESAAMAMLGGASLSQALTSAVQGEIRGQIAGQIAEATGLPAGFISALLGGSKPHKAAMSWLEGEMWGTFETEMSRVTGLPLNGVLSALWKKNEKKKDAKKAKKAAMIDAVVTVVAVVAAPFTGGGSLVALAAVKAAQGARAGGLQGALAGAAGVYVNAGAQALSGGTVSVDLSYSYENGFGAGVGFGIGPARIGISASERGGASITAGIGYDMGGGSLGLNVGYSTNGGLSAGVGYTNPTSGLSLGANYSPGKGLSGYAGFRPGGEGGASPPGSGFNLNFSGDGSISASLGGGIDGVNLGLKYDPENGFNATASGYGMNVGYGPDGLTGTADLDQIAGFAGIDTSSIAGLDLQSELDLGTGQITAGVTGNIGGFDIKAGFDSESGFTGTASGNGIKAGYGPGGLTGIADLGQIAELAGVDTSAIEGFEVDGELDLATGEVTAGITGDGIKVGVGPDGITGSFTGNIVGVAVGAAFDSESGFTGTASGYGVKAGYGPDGLTGTADLDHIAGLAGVDSSDIGGFELQGELNLASGEVIGGVTGNGLEANVGPGGQITGTLAGSYQGADLDLGYDSETGFTGNLNAGGVDLVSYDENGGLTSPYGNAIVDQVQGFVDDPTKVFTEDPFEEGTALGQLPGVVDAVEDIGEGIGEELSELFGGDEEDTEPAENANGEIVAEGDVDEEREEIAGGPLVGGPRPGGEEEEEEIVSHRGGVDRTQLATGIEAILLDSTSTDKQVNDAIQVLKLWRPGDRPSLKSLIGRIEKNDKKRKSAGLNRLLNLAAEDEVYTANKELIREILGYRIAKSPDSVKEYLHQELQSDLGNYEAFHKNAVGRTLDSLHAAKVLSNWQKKKFFDAMLEAPGGEGIELFLSNLTEADLNANRDALRPLYDRLMENPARLGRFLAKQAKTRYPPLTAPYSATSNRVDRTDAALAIEILSAAEELRPVSKRKKISLAIAAEVHEPAFDELKAFLEPGEGTTLLTKYENLKQTVPVAAGGQYTSEQIARFTSAELIEDSMDPGKGGLTKVGNVYERILDENPKKPRGWGAGGKYIERIEFLENGLLKRTVEYAYRFPAGKKSRSKTMETKYFDAQRNELPGAIIGKASRTEVPQLLALNKRALASADSINPVADSLSGIQNHFDRLVNFQPIKGENIQEFQQRVMKEIRIASVALKFRNNEARTKYLAHISNMLVTNGPLVGNNSVSSTQNPPYNNNTEVPLSRDGIPVMKQNGGLDCSNFVSMSMYAAGVSFDDFGITDPYNLNNYSEYSRPHTGWIEGGEDIQGGPVYPPDDVLANGPMYIRKNAQLLNQIPEPKIGAVAIVRQSAKIVENRKNVPRIKAGKPPVTYPVGPTSGHTFIVVGFEEKYNEEKKTNIRYLRVAEAGGETNPNGVATALYEYPGEYSPPGLEFYEMKPTFNEKQFGK